MSEVNPNHHHVLSFGRTQLKQLTFLSEKMLALDRQRVPLPSVN